MTAELFLTGAAAVVAAIGDPAVAASWDDPSVLEEQTVGGLAGHLARTGVMVVAQYLDADRATSATFDSAADYYATLATQLTPADHEAIRRRGADVGSEGAAATVAAADAALRGLQERLPTVPMDELVTVFAGSGMRLGDYLLTRVVEHAVHLDDLARSVPDAHFDVPPVCVDAVLQVVVEIGTRRHGGPAMLRALTRGAAAGVLPVL